MQRRLKAARVKHGERGQGLVEYALILVLVAIVVVVVLALVGPAVGNVLSDVRTALIGGPVAEASDPEPPAPEPPTGPTTWTLCASEDTVCSLPYGTFSVRYGSGATYVQQNFTGPINVQCSNAVFGDPIAYVVKHCDYILP